MILTLVFLGMIGFGIVRYCFFPSWDGFIEQFLCIFGGICLAACILIMIIAQSPKSQNFELEKLKYEKAVIEYRIDEQTNGFNNKLLYDDVFLYKDIVEYNEKIMTGKRNKSNLWVNWMFGNYWKNPEIDCIEIPDLDFNFNESKRG